jgi:hypothetical protein
MAGCPKKINGDGNAYEHRMDNFLKKKEARVISLNLHHSTITIPCIAGWIVQA